MLAIRSLFVSVVLLMGLAGGCGTPFLNSAATSNSLVNDPELVGEWTSEGDTITRAKIASQSAGKYEVILTVHHKGEFKSQVDLDVTLTDIGEARFWDLYLARSSREKLVSTYGFLAVPVHQIMKISRMGNELRVWNFNAAWLDSTAKSEKIGSNHIALGGGEVSMVTAPTDQVRDLILRHANDPAAFEAPIVFRRVAK